MVEPAGAARLVLAPNVVHLDPAPALFEAMLLGWERQQQSRFLNVAGTIAPRLALLRRFAAWTNLRFPLRIGHPEPDSRSGEGCPGASSIEIPGAVPP